MCCEKLNAIPRPEHPRPDFVRETFFNLNGVWQFAFDDENKGVREGWMKPGTKLPLEITVPFAYQTKASGLGPTDEIHPVIWYRRAFTVPQEMQGKRILIRFGAGDFECAVYVNGQQVGTHKGGYTPFALDVTDALVEGENDLCLRVQDDPDCTQPRGKQYWDRGLMGCWYTPVSGIWQTVYMEAVGEYGMKFIHVTPDYDRHMFTAEIALDKRPQESLEVELTVSFEGKVRRVVKANVEDRSIRVPVDMIVKGDLDPIKVWAPGNPNLYDLKVRLLKNGEAVDTVDTYFGMRKIERRDGRIYLNNSPLYQKLILDQGYWPDSNITPPSDEAIKLDLQYTLDFGYNGARKHQKLEDPRYYYWADKMGVLVWGELPSPYDYTEETVRNLADTMMEFIERDFNHPSIITWVPLNESWGVRQIYSDKRQQAAGRMLYHLTKAADGTRLCSANDGWEQVTTDICGYQGNDRQPLRRPRRSRAPRLRLASLLLRQRDPDRCGGVPRHRVRRHRVPEHRHSGRNGRHADLGLPRQGDGRRGVLCSLQGRDRRRARDSVLPGLLLHPADRRYAGNQRSALSGAQAEDGRRPRARNQPDRAGPHQPAGLRLHRPRVARAART